MNKILLVLLATISLNAHATWPVSSGAIGLTQTQSQQSNSDSNGGNVDVDNKRALPSTVSAIAPSQSINAICQVATPQSSATSVLFLFSRSQTDGVIYNDICYAYLRGQYDVADRLMCAKSAAYAKANKAVCEAK